MIKAGGVVFVSLKTKRVCLFLRSGQVSSPLTWGFVGGKIEKNEDLLKGISRELREEMGFIPRYKKVIPVDVFKSPDDNFMYYSFVVLVDKEFTPKLNKENTGYGWFNIGGLPKPLHSGAKMILMQGGFKKIFKEMISDNI